MSVRDGNSCSDLKLDPHHLAVELKVEGLEARNEDNLRQWLGISDRCRPCLLATVRRQALPRHEEDKNKARAYRRTNHDTLVEGRTKGWWSLLSAGLVEYKRKQLDLY